MYAVRIVSLCLLLVGIFLLSRYADSPLLIAGVLCVGIGVVLNRLSRGNRRG